MRIVIGIASLVLLAAPAFAGVWGDIASLKKAPSRAAWDRLVSAGTPALMPILQAWPTDDPVSANWLRTAFDQIAKTHPEKLPIDDLLAFASEPAVFGKARRVAIAAVEQVRPGTTAKLLPSWLNDPEFGTDAVAERLAAAELAKPADALGILKTTFGATTEIDQSLAVAKKLIARGEKPNIVKHLGVVAKWHVVGPFPVTPEEGLNRSFPPEDKLDLALEYDGKARKLKWTPTICDPADGRIDLVKSGIKPDDGAVAYAMATIAIERATKAELRLSAVDNITVWVNGKKAVERASEYRSMFRPDRYRATVELPTGETIILVKLTKTRAEEVRGRPAAPPKWDFLLRLTDEKSRGVTVLQAEPKK